MKLINTSFDEMTNLRKIQQTNESISRRSHNTPFYNLQRVLTNSETFSNIYYHYDRYVSEGRSVSILKEIKSLTSIIMLH